jgi:predicted nucleic acid-binding protein
MRYLVDTNLLSKRDNPRVRTWLLQHYLQLAISSVTVGEIAQGIEELPAGPKRARLQTFLKEMLEDYPVLPFNSQEALEWGSFVTSASRPVPVLDSIIAATALANNLEVATENTKDFPGVAVVNPLEA